MEMARKGQVIYMLYRAVTYGLSPFLYLHLQWRRLKGLEHPQRWQERLGRPSLARPSGPLLWFHAVSLGEGMAAIPVIKHCVLRRPDISILMTTTTASAFEVIKNRLPNCVLYQFAPIDTPTAMDNFLRYWNPNAIVLMESELWPNLILEASRNGIVVALLNARISIKSFNLWSGAIAQSLILLMLSKFSLIVPLQSTLEAIHFQLLQAPPFIINFAGDLKYATGDLDVSPRTCIGIEELQCQLANRQVWMAASIHDGEEEVILEVYKVLMQLHPAMLTIIVPRHPWQREKISLALQREGLKGAFRSRGERIISNTNIYVADTLGELQSLYRLTPIAVIGGSFFPHLAGHNFSEAAAAGCAIMTGRHIGHFSHMVSTMQRTNSLAVLQVSGKEELMAALNELLSDATALEARRAAAKQAVLALSNGIIEKVWNLLDLHVIQKTT